MQGLDCAFDCRAFASEIGDAGAGFVGRYYRNAHSKWTPLTRNELDALHGANLKVAALWEWSSNSPEYFSVSAGVDDGTSAYHQALKAGQAPNTPIYFAVDYDAGEEIVGSIADYFRGVHAGYKAIAQQGPSTFLVGVYGSGRTCEWLLKHQLVTHTWLAMSSKWSGYDTFKAWNIHQHNKNPVLSFDHDWDEATADMSSFLEETHMPADDLRSSIVSSFSTYSAQENVGSLPASESALYEELAIRVGAKAQVDHPGITDYAQRGADGGLEEFGKQLLNNWSATLRDFLCKSDGGDKDIKDQMVSALTQGAGATAILASGITAAFGLAPAIAIVVAALLIKLIIVPTGKTICQAWPDTLAK
jgi:hypothetical protein